MTQERSKVYAAVDSERDYQEERHFQKRHQSPRKYMEVVRYYATLPYGETDEAVMERILRIAAVAICAMEDNGIVGRK